MNRRLESFALLDVCSLPADALPEDFFEVVRLRVSNAELAALVEDPDLVHRVVARRRLDGLEQDVRRPTTPDGVAFHLNLALFPDGQAALEETAAPVAPGGFAAIGALNGATLCAARPRNLSSRPAQATRFSNESPTGEPLTGLAVRFCVDRMVATVAGIGPAGALPEEDVWVLAAAMEAHLSRRPPPPVSDRDLAHLSVQTSGESILRDAFTLLHGFHHRPLSPPDLLDAAYSGAAAFVASAHARRLPAPPVIRGSDPDVAWSEFVPAYQTVERLAEVGDKRAVAYAAARRMYHGHDCHTAFLEPPLFRRFVAASHGTRPRSFGMTITAHPPYLVVRVLPGSPAESAGLRAGDELIAVDGERNPADMGAGVTEILARGDRDGPLSITVDRPGMLRPLTVTVTPRLLEPVVARHLALPSGLGYCELNEFPRGDEAVNRVGTALTEFATVPVKGWILDLRFNGGGWARTMCRIAGLFLSEGRLLTTRYLPDGTEQRQESLGAAFPEQPPMAVLIGPTTVSAAEIVAETLRACGRAVLVGARTAGCVNGGRHFALLDGAGVRLAEFGFLIGPDRLAVEGTGVAPDIAVALSREDLAAGRDPQLVAAEQFLLTR